LIYRNHISDIKWVSEGLHEQKLAYIVKVLSKNFEKKRIVTISGQVAATKLLLLKELQLN
jgi:hypothetical protein